MKRLLLACLGMVLLGTAGLLVLHQVVEFPSAAKAQPGGGPAGSPGAPGPAGEARPPVQAGQYKELVPPLLDALSDADGGVRQLAAATLIKIGPDAVRPLIEALKAKDRETRANAAYVLGRLGEPAQEALPALAKALKDDDKEVRRRAAYALHNLVNRRHTVAAPGGAGPEGNAGEAVLAGPPAGIGPRVFPGGGPPMPGMQAPFDPGLLVPEVPLPARPPKEPK
jgi:hypothetical protein